MRQLGEEAADFLRENGVQVGDILLGDPIMEGGKMIERPVILRITAIGEQQVLGRQVPSSSHLESEGREHSWGFSNREWKKL